MLRILHFLIMEVISLSTAYVKCLCEYEKELLDIYSVTQSGKKKQTHFKKI